MRKRLFGLVIAMAAAFCIAGGMALTAFAQPQQAVDGQDMAAGNAELATQAEGDVLYIERSWDGSSLTEVTRTKASTEYTELTNQTGLAAGWYVLKASAAINERITVTGEVNLILCDGATLTASKGITVAEGNTLNIYPGGTSGSIAGTGKLIAGASSGGCGEKCAGIGGASSSGGTVNIHGGDVTAIGGDNGAGIGGGLNNSGGSGGSVTVYGGTVNATGGGYAAGIGGGNGNGGSLTVNGGTVNATGGEYGAGIGGGNSTGSDDINDAGRVTINGGIVVANGGYHGAGIGGGDGGRGSTVTVNGGTVNATGGSNGAGIGSGTKGAYNNLPGDVTITGGDVTATGGDNAAGIGGGGNGTNRGGSGANVTINGGAVKASGGEYAVGIGGGKNQDDDGHRALNLGGGVTLYGKYKSEPDPANDDPIAVGPGSYSGYNNNISRNRYMLTTFKPLDPIAYRAWDETTHKVQDVTTPCKSYITLTNQTSLSSGWYVLKSNATIDERITVTGEVNLILCDGATLTASKGIDVSFADVDGDGKSDNTLNIYPGSTEGSVEGTGALTATGVENAAGIGGSGNGAGGAVTIHGGTVTATGGDGAAGIGGGNGGAGGAVTIYDGDVTATGNAGAMGVGAGAGATANGTLLLGKSVALSGGTSADDAVLLATGADSLANVEARAPYMKAALAAIRYQAWDSTTSTVTNAENNITEFTLVDSSTASWSGESNNGWYVVSGEVAVSGRITVTGEANLILCDGATLTASKGITVPSGSTLNIYAQSTGANKGKLIAGASSDGCADGNAAIGGESSSAGGTVNIHGGDVSATGGSSAAGIGGGSGAAGAAVTIYGGAVNTVGGQDAMGIGAGAGAGANNNGTLETPGADVTMLFYSDNEIWSSTCPVGVERTRYMRTAAIYSVTLSGGANASPDGSLRQNVAEQQGMTTVTFTANDGYIFADFEAQTFDGVTMARTSETTVKVSGTPTDNVTIEVPNAAQPSVSYQAWDEGEKAVKDVANGCTSYTIVDGSTTTFTNGKWYVVKGDVSVSDRITVTGTAHLILCDGATLTASKGIDVSYADGDYDGKGDNTLNIYPGSTGDSIEGTGVLTATGSGGAAGIGGSYQHGGGAVVIHGGVVTATGGDYHSNGAAGIGGGASGNGGTVTINGGDVTATGVYNGAGIGGGRSGAGGTVTVNGGTVTATGDNWAAGIGGGAQGDGADVTVNGGTVKATAGNNSNSRAPGIGGGDWNETTTSPGTLKLGADVALYGGADEGSASLLATRLGLDAPYDGSRDKHMSTSSADSTQSVSYQEWSGNAVEDAAGGCPSYYVVNANTTAFKNGKWYVVNSNVTVPEYITVTGEANLILCDGATLTVGKGIFVRFADDNNDSKSDNILNIYAQSDGKSMGALTATGENQAAGVGGSGSTNSAGGAVNIHGGAVTATGGDYAAGIGGGSHGNGGAVTIYGGAVTATGTGFAAGIGGGNEGNGGDVAIYGGFVNAASGGGKALGIGGGEGHNNNGTIEDTDNGTLTLAGLALPLVVSDDNVHWSAYNATTDNRARYMRSTSDTVSVTLTGGTHATHSGGALTQTVAETKSITDVTFTADAGYIFDFTSFETDGIAVTKTDNTTVTVSGTPTATTEIAIPDAVPAPITYQAWGEDAKEMKTFHLDSNTYNVVDANTKKLAYDKPNVVSSDVTISDRITLIGNSATLIICDGATLTASKGIYVAGSDTLNIYSGSTGESVEGTGKLIAIGPENKAGIGADGNGFDGGAVVIHGGNVEAIGGANAAGIGSGSRYSEGTVANRGCNVTVYGGTVKATGSANSVGIGAGDYGNQHGALTLNGMALYGGESAAAKALIVGSLNGGYGGSRYAYMEIGPAVDVKPIPYRAWNEEYGAVLNVDGGCTSYIAMDANTTTLGDGNWYVVSSDVVAPSRITVSGTAHLILCDGVTLTASKGINVAKGSMLTAANDISTSGATLNIYTQSRGENAGKLIAGASNNGCSDYNAAIGGGNTEAGGTLNIHGGTVTAIGGRLAAGIGGGYHGDGGTINVYSGTVTATGGEQAAGIGGGSQGGAGGNISIHGGDVIAAGGANAAGIGGGSGGAGGTVIIRNSDVTAVGGQGAAGIGGGSAGAGGTVTIYNSAVDATGGQGGAGVGGGSQGDGGNVNITGGTVVTAAGEGAEGIGSGDGGGDHGSLSLGASLALYGGDSPDLTALAEKGVIQSKTHYVRSRYMTALDAVKGVTIVVDKLPGPDTVTTADKETVMNAQAAFGDLTADQKAKVPADTLKKLTDVEQALAAAEKEAADKEAADAAAAKIDALPPGDKVTPDDKAAIEAARAAYDALTMEQKAILDEDPSVLDYLVAAEKALAKAEADKAAADAVAGKIDALPEAGKVTIADKTAIEAARTAYDALTMEQKAILDEDPSILAYLMAAEEALKAAEEAVATPIDGAAIAAIPDQVYTAAPVEPALEVTLGGKELAAGADYDVAYADNVEVSTATGAATVTVTGKGAYKGTVTAEFKITSLAKKEAATRMRDLDPGAWYMGGDGTRGGFFGPESDTLYMDYTLARGLISGFKDAAGNVTGFGPDGDLSRAQAAVIIYRMANPGSTDTYSDVAAAGIANTSGLPDVEGGRYYTAAVNWCVERGIVTGYTDAAGRPYAFGPEDRVTREQLATFIGRYMDPQGAAGSDVSGFSDRDQISGYAKAGIAYCNANGIMTGVGGTKAFDPQGYASRCQMAKVIAVTDRLRTAE